MSQTKQQPLAAGWVTTAQAAHRSGYSATHIRVLAHQQRIQAQKVGRQWLIQSRSLQAYQARMAQLGPARHNPWRQSLRAAGRGRQAT